MAEAGDEERLEPKIDLLLAGMAKSKSDTEKWNLNILIFLFAVLIIVIILVSLEIDTSLVGPVAIVGLIGVWLMGRRRGKQLFQDFYAEEVSTLQREPSKEKAALVEQLTPREIHVLDYVAQGKHSYAIVARLAKEGDAPPPSLFRHLSEDFEYCLYGLGLVRQGWEQCEQPGTTGGELLY